MASPARRWLVRVAVAAAVVVALLAGLSYLVVFRNFAGLMPFAPDEVLPGGAVRIVDDQAGFTTMYLVPVGAEAMVLVDCGVDPSATAVKRELSRRGLAVEAVKAIFLTHGHSDHLGGCAAFPSARVMAMAAERGLVEGTSAAGSPMGSLAGVIATGLTLHRPLADGETVTVGELPVHAFLLPGHTPGSAAYLVAGALYVGDSFTITAQGALRPAPWVFSEDPAANRASIAGLLPRLQAAGLTVELVVPAHSGSAQGTAALAAFRAD